MDIQRNGTQPSGKGPAEWFTGTVCIDPLFKAPDPARVTLIVTAGSGLAQREDGPVEQIRPGDVVSFAPGEKHWHGAAPTTAMTHIAIAEALDGKVVDWLEHVSDAQYGA